MVLTAVVALNPVGLGFFHSAFFAGEQLARNIAQPIVLTVTAILALVVALEWLVRVLIINRRARGGTTA
jgi:flagellar biogenesis protein FliO